MRKSFPMLTGKWDKAKLFKKEKSYDADNIPPSVFIP